MIGRLLVLSAFLVGAAAFFLPMISVSGTVNLDGTETSHKASFSVMQVLQGVSMAETVADGQPESPMARENFQNHINNLRGFAMLPFAPTVLFFLVLLIGIKRFGRAHGVVALIVGVLGIAGWSLVSLAVSQNGSDAATFEVAFTLILVGSGLGFLGGIMGITKPEAYRT